MSNFRINRHFILLLLTLILFSCKKDKPDNPIDTNPTPSGPPAMTATVDGTGYTATEFNARKTTTGAMRISTSNGSESILLVVANFTGETSYNLNTSVSFATYSNGTDNFSTVSNGSGTLVISSYNQTNHTISGTFQFTAGMVGSPANTVTVTSGSFTNISVLANVPQPQTGEALYIEQGVLITADEARAYVTDHYRFVIEVDHNENRWKYNTYANPAQTPLNYAQGILVRKSLATNTFLTAYNNPGIQITEYNEAEQYVSGRIFLTTMDLDIRFHRLPITPSTPVASTQVILTNSTEQILFDNNQFQFIGGDPTTYRLEANNGFNQMVVLQVTFGSLDLPPSHGFGRTGTLDFYDDASGSITYTKTGYWHSYPDFPGRNVGFLSFDGTVKLKGYRVPL
jgi:hypothetical protein